MSGILREPSKEIYNNLTDFQLCMVTLQLRQPEVPVGQRLLIRDLDWQKFEYILAELGENPARRTGNRL
ncbi:MAG: hypothetical protein ACFBSC_14445 [Microcoleaceae cyanobacterium]